MSTARQQGTAEPRRILVVEDRAPLRQAVEELIETDDSLRVYAATESAEDALATLEGSRRPCPDLAVVDISLPGMNGLALTSRLRELCPGMPVLILSSHAPEVYERPAIAAGARAYLAKNRTAEDLLASIHRLLAASRPGAGGRGPSRSGGPIAGDTQGDDPGGGAREGSDSQTFQARILRRRPFALRAPR